jgi:hypothetical protein
MKTFRAVLILCTIILLADSLPEKSLPPQPAAARVVQPASGSPLTAPDADVQQRVRASYAQLPFSFEANQGQADSNVKFLSRGSGYQLSLKATEAELRLASGTAPRAAASGSARQSAIVRMKLLNANPTPQMAGRDELPGKSHYYIGNDPKDWRTNVATYAKVEYEQVWPGINLVYYGNQRQLEYDFIVAPGADPNAIHFTFDGAAKVKLDAQGNLVLHVAGGEVVLQKPFVYQEVNGARQQIAGNYQIRNPQSAIERLAFTSALTTPACRS